MNMNSNALVPTATRRFSSPESHAAHYVVRSAFADDPDFTELIEFFVGALPERHQALQQALAREDYDELRVMAHQLKGAGGGYGFDDLSCLASQLEEACKHDQTPEISARVRELLDHIDCIQA